MNDARNMKVIVIKDGEPRELHNLPQEILTRLDEAYEKAPIKGLSHKTYMALADFFESKLAEYDEELKNLGDGDTDELFAKSVAFAKAFNISYNESPFFFDLMLMIERSAKEQKSFGSQSICMKNLKMLIGRDWQEANYDFRKWSRKLFEDSGLRIGVIRMTKFYYGVITAA